MLPISNIFKYIKYCPYIEYIDGMRLDNSEYMAEYCPYLMFGYRSLTHRRSSCCATQRPQRSPPEEYH